LIGGALSGMIMNSFECIMYLRMADMENTKSMREIYKEKGVLKLCTKGLKTRIVMTCGYSLMQFNLLHYFGKAFNCDLLDHHDDSYLESLPE
jgi:hypothetical protein